MSDINPGAFEPEGWHEVYLDGTPAAHYRIHGMSEADWALRKLAQARRRIADNDELYGAELTQLYEWRLAANAAHERDAKYFEAILWNWHEQKLVEDAKCKTVSLPAGKLVAAKNPDSITIDAEVFVPWALEHAPEWVRTKHEPAKSDVKSAKGIVEETGEIAPGVEVVPGELRWKAETK